MAWVQLKPKFHVIFIGTDKWTADADKMAELFIKVLKYPRKRVHVLNKVGADVFNLLSSPAPPTSTDHRFCVTQGKGPAPHEVIDKISQLSQEVGKQRHTL